MPVDYKPILLQELRAESRVVAVYLLKVVLRQRTRAPLRTGAQDHESTDCPRRLGSTSACGKRSGGRCSGFRISVWRLEQQRLWFLRAGTFDLCEPLQVGARCIARTHLRVLPMQLPLLQRQLPVRLLRQELSLRWFRLALAPTADVLALRIGGEIDVAVGRCGGFQRALKFRRNS